MQIASTIHINTPGNGNPGIVPPWLQRANRNPGIVPPWLQGRPVGPTDPVDDDTPRIFGDAPSTAWIA